LTTYAKEEWQRIHTELIELGANISGLDYVALVCYCDAFGKVQQSIETLQLEGDTVTNNYGHTAKHPAHTILNTSRSALRNWAVELGLTPGSRGKIPMAKAPERVNKFHTL
jgi:P27 family predicted phage terminase small subunit